MMITIPIIMIMVHVQVKRRKDKYVGLSFLVLNLKDNEQLSIMKGWTLRTVAEPPLSTHFSPEMSFLYRSANEDFFISYFLSFIRIVIRLTSCLLRLPSQTRSTRPPLKTKSSLSDQTTKTTIMRGRTFSCNLLLYPVCKLDCILSLNMIIVVNYLLVKWWGLRLLMFTIYIESWKSIIWYKR